jgi:hypothetical protein
MLLLLCVGGSCGGGRQYHNSRRQRRQRIRRRLQQRQALLHDSNGRRQVLRQGRGRLHPPLQLVLLCRRRSSRTTYINDDGRELHDVIARGDVGVRVWELDHQGEGLGSPG